jgi:hypothetical protein
VQTITELIVRVADLAEAEGRTLRAATMRVTLGIGLVLIAVGAVTAGVVLLLGALYIVIAGQAGAAAGAAVTGAIALAAGGILAWLGRRTGT